MDRTSIDLGSDTRDSLRAFKNAEGYPNYDTAVQELLADRDD